MPDKNSAVHAYTDGACRGNPGPGGWGVVLRYGDRERELSGYSDDTTNNRMEITAAIEALKALNRRCVVILSTDSRYLKDGVEQWLERWKKNGWRTAGRKPVKNQDLWLALDEQVALHDVSWRWIKGHSGHEHNERADRLANLAIDGAAAGERR